MSGTNNPGQGLVNEWIPSIAMHCKTQVSGVEPDQDYFMCGPEFNESMHFMEAFDDNHTYVYNSARIRQPFDFTNRTGKITFDVDAKTAGSHGWWVEIWITDDPSSAPHGDSDPSFPRNGVAIRFHNPCWQAPPAGTAGAPQTTVGEVDVVHNFALDTAPPWGGPDSTGLIVHDPSCINVMPDMRNHFEIRLNQQHLEVWATDDDGTNFHEISYADGLNLNFTRGYVHLQHAQYNASKAAPGVVDYQTYHWDNVGFDGPILPVPAEYSIPDALTPGADSGAVNLGYVATTAGLQAGPRTFQNVNLSGATSATLAFNEWARQTINYRLNGGTWHAFSTVDEATFGGSNTRAMTIPVSLAELRSGSNTVDFKTNADVSAISNIELILNGATGTGSPPPTPTSVPPTPVPSGSTPTPVPTSPPPTPVPSGSTPTPVPATTAPSFVQTNNAVPQSPVSSVKVTYSGAQTAGDTNVLAIGWNDSTSSITSVKDSAGNVYRQGVGTARGAGISQAIWYASNIKAAAAGANVVTVTFNTAVQFPDIRIMEYKGLDPTSPFDSGASGAGSGGIASSGATTMTAANDLLVGAGITTGGFSGPGNGYTMRVITNPDADMVEDRVSSTTGSAAATGPTSGNWVMQVAAFKAH